MGLEIVEPKKRLFSFEELEFGVIYVVSGEFRDFSGCLCQKFNSEGIDVLVLFGVASVAAFYDGYLKVKIFQELPNGSVINYTK